jgi:hypothetical protein
MGIAEYHAGDGKVKRTDAIEGKDRYRGSGHGYALGQGILAMARS